MSKYFNLPPVDVIEAKVMEIKIYHFYPLILKRFEEFKKENLNAIKNLIQRLKKNPPSIGRLHGNTNRIFCYWRLRYFHLD